MANKREFKKFVDQIGSSICASMVDICETVENVDKNKAANAVEQILSACAAAKSNADVTFDKGVKAFDNLRDYSKAKKDFYRQLFKKVEEDFYKEIDEALKEFNSGVPQDIKEENKTSVK